MKKYLTSITISLFFILGCKTQTANKNKSLDIREVLILKNSLNTIMNEYSSNTFIVNPYFKSFEFNDFTFESRTSSGVSNNKSFILKNNKWDEKTFTSIKKSINNLFLGSYYKDLLNLSNAKKSNILITFSGIESKMFFVEIISFCEKIDKNTIINEVNTNMPKHYADYLIVTLKDNKVDEIIVDNGVVFELQCKE
jgi:cell division protein FtsI/penicillin-binding protein 2